MIWLALHFPHMALDLVTRANDLKRELPIAINDGKPGKSRIVDCNPAATHHGIRPGLAINAALALCEGLHVAVREPDNERAALQRLAAWCYQYSSHVSIDSNRCTLLLEAGASQRLFGAADELAQRLHEELLRLGCHAQAGTAPTPEAARLAASQGLHITDAPAISNCLRQLPLHSLQMDKEQHSAVEKMGFRKAGELLRLPRKALARRLGPSLADYLDRLTGVRPDPQKAWRPAGTFSSGLELPAELHNNQGLLFPLKRLVTELCGVLRAADCGVQEIDIRLGLRKGFQDLRLGLQNPCREEAHFMLLLRERLERLRLPQPVVHIRLRAGQFMPFDSRQDSLFADEQQGPDPVEPLLERLQARLGPDAVAGLRGVADHRPEHSWSRRGLREPAECEAMPQRPVWLLNKPRRCRIEDYRVLAGPERIEAGWWDGGDCRRDYFVVRDSHGSTLWAYREYKPSPGWYLQGIFA